MRRNLPIIAAAIALFASVGGFSLAADATAAAKKLLTGARVKDGAISSNHVRNGSLTAADLAPGALARGAAGEPGAQGPAGPQGAAGDRGPAGADGARGPKGLTGPDGPQGAKGAAGPKGATGAKGPVGDTGPTGDTGPAGPAGPQGAKGPTGPAGPAGANGFVTRQWVTLRFSNEYSETVSCPAGRRAVGGGYDIGSGWAAMFRPDDSAPTLDGTGWQFHLWAREAAYSTAVFVDCAAIN